MKRRTRRRGSSWWRLRVSIVLCLLIGGMMVGFASPSASFTAASLNRDTQADVVADGKSVLNLSVASNVTLGSTEQLVSMTNELNDDSKVTVQLRNGSADDADLVLDSQSVGDTTTFTLSPDESESISVKVLCAGSLSDNQLYFDTELNSTSVSGTIRRDVPINDGVCTRLVYVVPSSRDLRSIRNDSGITRYNATDVQVVAPHETDFDGDGRIEVPFVNSSNGNIYAIDKANETTVLLDVDKLDTLLKDGAEHKKSRMTVGTWNGSDSAVFFVDDGEDAIYRTDKDGDSDEVVKIIAPGDGAGAVFGITDIDNDGAKEIVFVSASTAIHYVQEDGSTVEKISVGGVGSNKGIGVGEPADFDGDGLPRVPFVDGSGTLSLATYNDTVTELKRNGNQISVDKAPLAAFDWDSDGRPEIIAMHDNGELIVVDNIGGDITVTEITSDGSPVDAAQEPGPA